jgi:hypothetical protein
MEHNQSNLGLDQCHDCGVRRKQVANPTTNYGFVLPTPTDLVTDLPADFDVALQGVDTRLKALQPGTTEGDLAYSSSTANTNTRLAIGTTGQILTVAGGVPAWAAAPSGSPVIQVLNATNGTNTIVGQNTTWTDTGLTINITPTLSTSTILVFASINGIYKSAGNENSRIGLRLMRNSTAIHNIEGIALRSGDARTLGVGGSSTTYLDSPATTSSTTYKVQMLNWVYADYVAVNMISEASGSNPYMYSTSSITVMEIGA